MKPTVIPTITGLRIIWQEEQIQADVRRIRRRRDDNVAAEITLTTWAPGYSPHLSNTLLYLNSGNQKAALAKSLTETFDQFNWHDIIEQLSMASLAYFRKGEPVELIPSDDEIKRQPYLLYPLLPLNKPTIIYGDGGTGKSLISLFIATIVTLAWRDNPLGLEVGLEAAPVCYLDWESDKDDIDWRAKAIQNGHGLPKFSVHYRRCVLPLVEDIEQVQQIVMDTGIKLVIVDSVGQASGRDLNDAETAIELFRALRSLKVTSLLIAHVTKEYITKGKTPIGTVYFRNAPRSAWEVKKAQNVGENELSVGLFHGKTNVSKLFPPIGMNIIFEEDAIRFALEDTGSVGEFIEELTLSQRIMGLLKSGPLTTTEIAGKLNKSYDVTSTTLKRVEKRKNIIKVGDKWGLLLKNSD